MGPPPPPPPPPPLQPSAILPSGGWKTANAPRRVDNPLPAPPQQTRPRVDSAALQHAAARLRKTGYNEQIRDNVPHLPNGRVDRPHERLPVGDRPNCPQQQLLDLNPPREPVHASPARSYHTDSLSDLRQYPYSINKDTDSSPLHRSTFDSTPKSLFQTFNNPSSQTFIEKTIPSPDATNQLNTAPFSNKTPINNAYNNNSAYSLNREMTTTTTTRNSASPYSSSAAAAAAYNTPTVTQYPSSARSPTNNTAPTSRETTLQWTSPYVASKPVAPPILDPHSRIHDFATQNFIREDGSTAVPVRVQTIPAAGYAGQTTNSSRINSLAKEIRDQSLTSSQRAANQYQQPTRRDERLPFDVNRIVQQSYKGDEVDALVGQMASQLSSGGGRGGAFEGSPSVNQRSINNSSSTTTSSSVYRTNVMQDNNICVACKSEITIDRPGCTALDQIFHVACFNCKQCGKVLAGASFYNIDSNPTCESCYQNSLDKCTKCGTAISDKLLRACGGTFHVDCFMCTACSKLLDGIPFTVDSENNVHCVPCFHEKFAPRCAECSKGIVPVEGEKESVRVVAMDKSFHVECYKCHDCGIQLSSKIEGQGCYPLDSTLLCKTCNSNRLRAPSSVKA